jgi:hypothetical protein
MGPRLSFWGRTAACGAHYPAPPRTDPRGRDVAACTVRRRVRCLPRPNLTADSGALLNLVGPHLRGGRFGRAARSSAPAAGPWTFRSISSLLDAPVWECGEGVGVLRHEHVGPPREWSPEEIDFVSALASIVSLALEESRHCHRSRHHAAQAGRSRIGPDAGRREGVGTIAEPFRVDGIA